MDTLYVRSGTEFREATTEEIITRAQVLISQHFRVGSDPISNPALTRTFLRLHLGTLGYEVFGMLHLDTRHRLIKVENLFRGTLDRAEIYAREVVHSVITHGSAAVILYHNHPSGIAEPSRADEAITQRLKAALALIDVKILDHLIVAETIFSFAEHSLL